MEEFQARVLVQGETYRLLQQNDGQTVITPYLAYDPSNDRFLSGVSFETKNGSVFVAVMCDPITGWRTLNYLEDIQESDSEGELFQELLFLGQLACLGSEEATECIMERMGHALGAEANTYPSDKDILAIWDNIPDSAATKVFLSLELRRAILAGDLGVDGEVAARLDDFDCVSGRVFAC